MSDAELMLQRAIATISQCDPLIKLLEQVRLGPLGIRFAATADCSLDGIHERGMLPGNGEALICVSRLWVAWCSIALQADNGTF